jgi:CDP-paratose 2-epimerase
MSAPVLVTGGAGFIGCNLADRLAREGHDVIILDALARPGVETNLEWLKERHGTRIHPIIADIRDEEALAKAVRDASAVFHMAAQVAVTTSIVDPLDDFEINIRGTLALLEAVRRRGGQMPVIFASTNKVYGDLADIALEQDDERWSPVEPQVRDYGISESRPLDFHTPYGCSKGAADQYVLDYARSYGMPTTVIRMSCVYGPRQMGTEDQGWVAHFLIRALEGQPITIYGDGKQVRDVLHVDDAVDAYVAAWRQMDQVSGRVFNLGGGPANAISLRQLLRHVEDLTARAVETRYEDWRAGDQRYFVADARAAQQTLGLAQPKPWRHGIAELAEWLANVRALPLHAAQMEAAE